jgi:hypothetical protein
MPDDFDRVIRNDMPLPHHTTLNVPPGLSPNCRLPLQ